MKKIFILTGEPSGDKLASTVISKLKKNNPNIEYLSVGGTHIKKLGIKSIIKILNNEKIKVISSVFFNPELTVKRGNYTKLKANRKDINSIKMGITYFNKLKSLDHVQAIIVKNNTILAIEDQQGTKKMLSKLKKKSEGILIKLPKKKQDLRMDLPTIGIQTLKDCKKYGLKGIVLRSKKNIFLDKAKCIAFANKNKIFVKII